ncbi:hypothetical protein D3C71_1511760 [compost metagenome]
MLCESAQDAGGGQQVAADAQGEASVCLLLLGKPGQGGFCLGDAPLSGECLQGPAGVQTTGAAVAFKSRKAVGGCSAALQFGGARDLALLLLQPLGAGQHLGDGFCEGCAVQGASECCRCSSWS